MRHCSLADAWALHWVVDAIVLHRLLLELLLLLALLLSWAALECLCSFCMVAVALITVFAQLCLSRSLLHFWQLEHIHYAVAVLLLHSISELLLAKLTLHVVVYAVVLHKRLLLLLE